MKILYSVTATFEGVEPAGWCPHETTIKYALRAWPLLDGGDVANVTEAAKAGDWSSEYDAGLWIDSLKEGDEIHTGKFSGVLTRAQLVEWLYDIGAGEPDACTMGTLGGPLGWGCVPDVNFRMESRWVVECIRVSPFVADDEGNPLGLPSEWAIELWCKAMARKTWGRGAVSPSQSATLKAEGKQ